MEKIKRITTYILMIFVGTMCFFACTKNPYKNMSLTVDLFVEVGTDRQEIKMGDDGYYTISLDSANTTPTILSVEAVVGGVDDKVSKAVVISSSDKNVASKRADGTLSVNTTVEKYDIKAGGVTTFTINTAEGNKSVVARLRVVEPIRGLKFVAPSIAVVRGQLANIAGLDNKYVSFVPATTSQKQLKSMQAYKADTSEIEPDVEIDGVNLRVASTSIVTSFKLRITSNYVTPEANRIQNNSNTENEYKYDTEGHPYDEVVVNVLEPIGSIGLFENIPTIGEGTDKKPIKDVANKTGVEIGSDTYYSLKDDLTNKYGILLSSNIEKYKTATIGVLRENDKNKFGELPSAYSISIPDLVAGGKLDGINSVMIDVMSSSKIVLRATDLLSDYSLDIHVGYAGYESMIDGVTISLDLDIEVYPDDIKMYDLKGNELKVVTEGESESYAITVYSTYGLDYQYGTGIRLSMLLQGQPLDSNQKMYLKIAKDDIVAKEQATEDGVTYSKDVLEVRDGNGASLKVPNFERTENNATGGTTTYYYFELKNNSIVYLKPGADMNTQMSPKSFSIISRNNSELKKQIAVSKYVSDIEFTTQTSPVYINVNDALKDNAGYQVTSKEVGLDGISNWEEVISDVVITDNNNVLAQKPYEYAKPKDGANDAKTIKLLVNGNKNLGEATIKLIAKNGKACTLRVIVFMPIGVDNGEKAENNISFNLLNYTITPTSDTDKEKLKSIQLKNDADGTVSDYDNKLTGTFGKIVAKEGETPQDIWSYVQNGNNEYMAYNENGILASQKFVSVAKIDDIKDKTYSLALVQLLVGQTYKLSLTLNNKVYYTDTMPSGMRFKITPNKAYGSKVIGSEITTRYNGFEKIDISVTGKNAEGSDVELKTAFYIQTQVPLSTAKFSESSTTVYSISSLSNKGEVGTKSNRELYGIYEFTFTLTSLGSNTLLDSCVISADVSFTFSQQDVNFLYDSKEKYYDIDKKPINHDTLISNKVANSQSLIELIKSSNISASKEYWFSNDSPNDKYCAVVLDMGDGTYRFLIDKYNDETRTSFASQSLSLTSLFKQTYIDEIGHKKTMPIYDTLNVTVIPAPYISSITAIVPDNMVTFDNRKMTTDNNGVFNSNNTSTFKYTYIVANVDKYGVKRPLNNEIVIDGSQYDVSVAVDIEKQEISVKANRITNPVNPVYTFVLNVCGTKGLDGGDEGKYATKITLTVKITNGSENAPYEIANANDLHDIGRAMSSHYVLTRDINMSGFNWTPIVGEFTGSLNGHYTLPSGDVHKYVISNLTTTAYSLVNNDKKSYYGIFQIIGEKGVVQNLTINGVSVQLTYTQQTDENALVCVGVIAGVNNGSIVNCSVVDGILWDKLSSDTVRMSSQIKNGINFTSDSTKKAQFNIGGFVGQNNGTVGDETNASICHMNILYKIADVNSSAFVGGMIGENAGEVLNPDIYAKNNNLSIQNCLVKSIIRAFDQNVNSMNNGKAYVGGVCGINSGNISRVRARVYIKDKTTKSEPTESDSKHAIGGAVGVNTGRIVECVVIPTLIGNSNIGGIVGANIDDNNGTDKTFKDNNVFFGIFKGCGRLYNNKVQFVDLNDSLSSFNTSISGYSKIGGLIGYFVGRVNAIGYAIESNSVYSYYTRDLSTFAYSEVDASGQYYGDIVGKTNVGGLIGEAYGAFVYGTYVKANIYVYENTGDVYIGGVIGRGDICNVTDGSVYVNVISKLTDANYLKAGAVFGYVGTTPNDAAYAIEKADKCMEEGGTSSEANKSGHHVATTFACATQGDNYLPFAGSSSSVAGVNNCIIDGTTNTLENTTKSNTVSESNYDTYVKALSLYRNDNAEVGNGFTGEKAWIESTQKYYYHNDISGGRPILFATRNGSRYTAYDKSEIDADGNETIVSQSIRLIVDLPPTQIDVEHNDKIATHAISTITSRKLTNEAPVKSTRVAKSNTTSTTSTDVPNKDNNTTNFDNQSIATYSSQTTPEIKSTAITSGAGANTRNDYYRVEDNDRVGVVVSMYDVDLSGYYVDARGGIDFSGDKIVDSFEFVLSNRLYNKIIELNTYKYNDLVKIITLPPMLANFNVINIEIDGQSVMLSDDGESLVALETGKSTITISSIFDSNVSAQFDVYVINAVRDFKLMDSVSSTDELSQINTTINVPKTISTYFDNQISFDENVLSYYYNRKFNVAQNGNYGVRLYVSTQDKHNLYFDTPNYWFNMTINNMPFSSQKISATDGTTTQDRYLYYIDVNASDALNIKTFKDERDYHLIAVPYILVDGKVTLLDSFHDTVSVEAIVGANGEPTKELEYIIDENNYIDDTLSKYIVVNAKHGTHDISSSITGDASSNKFTPESSLDFSIIVESDKEKTDKVEPGKVGDNLDNLLYLDIISKGDVSLFNANNSYAVIKSENGKSYSGLAIRGESGTIELHDGAILLTYQRTKITDGVKGYKYDFNISVDLVKLKDLISTAKDLPLYDDYKFTYMVVKYDNTILSQKFAIRLDRQPVTGISASHYAGISLQTTNVTEIKSTNYYKSDTLISTYSGLLAISITPDYGAVDYLRVTVSGMNQGTVSLSPILAMYSKSGGHEVFQDKYMLYSGSQLVGNSIRVNKISRIVDNATQKYDGNIYLSTMCILNAGVDYSQFTLTIDAYTFDSTTPLKSVTKTIEVVSAPSVDMSINGRKYVAVAKGTYVDLKVTSNMDDVKIEYDNSMAYNKLTGKLYVGVTEGEYKIQATVTKTIHDRKFEYTDTLHVIVVPYVVTGINVNRVTNGRFIGNYNQPYILSVSLTANYAPIYEGAVATALNKLADAISKDLTHTFYLVSGSRGEVYYENIIGGGQYADFHIEEKDGYFVLRNNVSNPTSRLGAQAVIDYGLTYDKNGEANGYGATKNPETMSQYAEYINCEFVLEFSRLSTLDNPEPIFTAQELLNMRAGGHYILLSDITLSPTDTVAPFTAPIDTAIGSLDGNDYIITISGFPVVQSDNIGLFSTIYADSIIKNLTIEIPFNEELTKEVESGKLTAGQDLYVDVTQNETTRFGILAGTNNGIVTNALVVNPAKANAIRTSRDAMLKKDGSMDESDNSAMSVIIDNRTTSIVRVSSNITPSAQSRIAGLVGVNSGYITKSRVQNVSIFGDNFVSGFVCENSSIIGTSSAVGVNVSASASPTLNTALGASGFVLINNKNASIVECMVEGAEKALYHGTNDDNKIDMGGLVGNHDVRNQNTFVNSTANATGFVFNNEGSVTDCYSNVVILGTLTSGFVFANGEDGKINNSIAFSSVYANQITAQPFTATKGSGTSYNNLGSITNCYYFIGKEESFTEPDSTSGAVALNADAIKDTSVLDSFAFGNNAEDFASIWYMENNIPRLTSVDRVSLSLRVYCATDNENVAQKIYSGILAWDDSYRINTLTITTPMRSFSRNDISVTINGNNVEVIVRFDYSGKDENDPTKDKTQTIIAEIKDIITKRGTDKTYKRENITINIIPTTSALSSSSSFNYYYIGNEYGTENNPYLITSAEDYNSFVLRKVQTIKDGEIKNEPTREAGKNVPDYMRIVSDFAFTKHDLVAETYNMDYSGVIDGNGMTISNLRVIADKDDVYAIKATDGNGADAQYTALGMFRRLTGGVKSLNINVSEVKGSGVNLVGVIAGEINSGYVHNVNITSAQAISGLNAVGGVAGRVLGSSKISSVTVNVAVEATYYTTRNQFNISNYNTVKDNGTFYIYNGSVEGDVDNSNITKVSYAGSVVGILDTNDNVLDVNATNNVAGNGTMVYGEIVGGLYGYVGSKSTVRNSQLLIGGMENEDDKYTSARLSGTRATGGIVGHNIGDVRKVSVSYIDRVQSVIDTAISNASKSANTTGVYDVDNGTLDLFAGNAHYIGGVVGLNDGTLMYAYNKINVANLSSLYAGGIIGASTSSGVKNKVIGNGIEYYPVREVYTTASVYAFHGQGGLIGALFTPQWISTIDSDTIMPQHAFIANGLNNGKLDEYGNRVANSFNHGGNNISENTPECFPAMQSVASNMWKLDHINPTRASLTAIDAPVAHIGSLVGANYTKAVANNMYSRIINELNYTIQTYSYNTISLGILDNTARVISEIGNDSKDAIGKIFDISVDKGKLIDYIDLKIDSTDPQQYYEKHQDLQYKSGSDLITFAYSGNMYSKDNNVGGTTGEVYHFSRMRTYSSIRTLREIVNATYDNTDANAFTRRYASNANETINAIRVDNDVAHNKSAKLPNIYSGWQSNIWRGVQMNGREKVDKTTFPTISPNVLGKADTTINWTITDIVVTVEIECATTGQLGTKPSINGDDHFSTTSAAEVTLSSDGSKVGSVKINTGDKYTFVGYKINGVSYSADKDYKLKFGSSPIIYAVFEYIPSSYKVSVNELYLDDTGKEHEITNKRDIIITENANNNQGFTITEDINKVTVDNKKYPKSITIAGIQYSYSSATDDYCVAGYSVSGSTKKGDIYPVTDSNVSIQIVYKRIPKKITVNLKDTVTNSYDITDGTPVSGAGQWAKSDGDIVNEFTMLDTDYITISTEKDGTNITSIIVTAFDKDKTQKEKYTYTITGSAFTYANTPYAVQNVSIGLGSILTTAGSDKYTVNKDVLSSGTKFFAEVVIRLKYVTTAKVSVTFVVNNQVVGDTQIITTGENFMLEIVRFDRWDRSDETHTNVVVRPKNMGNLDFSTDEKIMAWLSDEGVERKNADVIYYQVGSSIKNKFADGGGLSFTPASNLPEFFTYTGNNYAYSSHIQSIYVGNAKSIIIYLCNSNVAGDVNIDTTVNFVGITGEEPQGVWYSSDASFATTSPNAKYTATTSIVSITWVIKEDNGTTIWDIVVGDNNVNHTISIKQTSQAVGLKICGRLYKSEEYIQVNHIQLCGKIDVQLYEPGYYDVAVTMGQYQKYGKVTCIFDYEGTGESLTIASHIKSTSIINIVSNSSNLVLKIDKDDGSTLTYHIGVSLNALYKYNSVLYWKFIMESEGEVGSTIFGLNNNLTISPVIGNSQNGEGVVQNVTLHYLDENYVEKTKYEVLMQDFEGKFEFCVDVYRDMDLHASSNSGVITKFPGKDKVLCHPVVLISKGLWADEPTYWVYDNHYDEGYGYSYTQRGQYTLIEKSPGVYIGISVGHINVTGCSDVYIKPMKETSTPDPPVQKNTTIQFTKSGQSSNNDWDKSSVEFTDVDYVNLSYELVDKIYTVTMTPYKDNVAGESKTNSIQNATGLQYMKMDWSSGVKEVDGGTNANVTAVFPASVSIIVNQYVYNSSTKKYESNGTHYTRGFDNSKDFPIQIGFDGNDLYSMLKNADKQTMVDVANNYSIEMCHVGSDKKKSDYGNANNANVQITRKNYVLGNIYVSLYLKSKPVNNGNVTLTIKRDIFTTSSSYLGTGNNFSYGGNETNGTDNWWINAGGVEGRKPSIKVAKDYDITITMKSKNYSDQLKKISGELTSQTGLADKRSALQDATANYATGYQITIDYQTWENGSLKKSSLTIDCFELQHKANNLTAIKHLNGYSIGNTLNSLTNQGINGTVSSVTEAYGSVETGTTKQQTISGNTTLNLYIGFSDRYYGWNGNTFKLNNANYD